jgi:spore cortex protein
LSRNSLKKLLFPGGSSLKQKFFKLTGLAISFAALSACGTQDYGFDNDRNGNIQRVGFYSNDKNNNRDTIDNQGPISEIMEEMTNRGQANVADRNRNMGEQPLDVNNDQGDYSRGDMNYHNHVMNTGTGEEKKENKELSDEIKGELNRQNNIDDADVLVTDSTILISIRTDEVLTQARKNQIEQTVSKYANNRTVQITNDKGTFTRMRNVNGDNAGSR